MSRRKNPNWEAFKGKNSRKHMGNKTNEVDPKELDYLTVQRLSPSVEGKCQKYSRIGPLTMVPFGCELTIENIKTACQAAYFEVPSHMQCDLLAGERGPSFTEINQIKSWKMLHIRFVEKASSSSTVQVLSSKEKIARSEPPGIIPTLKKVDILPDSRVPVSVPLSAMLKMGKLIRPNKDIVTLQLEEFPVEKKGWLDPCEVKLSLCKEKFARGGFRDAYDCSALSGLNGRYVLKRYKKDQEQDIEDLFGTVEIHTRKVVQMHTLARNFAKRLTNECLPEFGEKFTYTKIYFGKMGNEFVTVENFIEGDFVKYINNTGDIILGGSNEVVVKAEAFVHFTYVRSNKRLCLDIQRVGYNLCDPEIASATLVDDADNSILFCSRNLSREAIDNFFKVHNCSTYCKMLCVDSK